MAHWRCWWCDGQICNISHWMWFEIQTLNRATISMLSLCSICLYDIGRFEWNASSAKWNANPHWNGQTIWILKMPLHQFISWIVCTHYAVHLNNFHRPLVSKFKRKDEQSSEWTNKKNNLIRSKPCGDVSRTISMNFLWANWSIRNHTMHLNAKDLSKHFWWKIFSIQSSQSIVDEKLKRRRCCFNLLDTQCIDWVFMSKNHINVIAFQQIADQMKRNCEAHQQTNIIM